MAGKRHTIRYELPAEDVQPLHTHSPGADSMPAWAIGSVETPEGAADPGYPEGPVYELMGSSVEVGDDGRVKIDCDSKLARAVSLMYRPAPSYHEKQAPEHSDSAEDEPGPPGYEESIGQGAQYPRLNVLIQVVGSRGDVQPFIALGNEIQRLGFRVRLATHDVFEKFVRDAGLEFYPVGGDPAALMAYMVKNPGLIPKFQSLRAGEIQQKREMVEEMLEGFWYSCFRPDPVTEAPFVADAIIANPPSFAHVHCAQALGIPVHIMFTMPWTSTSAFPHPLANLRNSSGSQSMANYASYAIVEYLTWQGLGDVINRWRNTLDLEDVAMFDGPLLAERLRIPFTYCWSPALVPKPADWGAHIDVCGFFFRDPPSYTPPQDLARFLSAGLPPVYIGFGSIVLEDPERVVRTLLDAVRAAGVRAIISKGWSNLAGPESDDVYWIGDCPHEWLFAHVAAVVHHGGAGTTACGLRNGVPTIVVPFFGDQPFWGEMVANAGAGPKPIPSKQLDSQKLADGITYCLTPQARSSAQSIAEQMKSEQGVQAAAQSWLRQLPKHRLRCDLVPTEPAAWVYKKGKKPIKLSKIAAEELVSRKVIEPKQLEHHPTKSITMDVTRWDPITGGASAVMATAVDMTQSITGMVTKPVDEYRHEQRRRERQRKRELARQGGGASHDTLEVAALDGRSSPTGSHTSGAASTTTTDDPGAPKPRSMAGAVAGASAKSIGMIGPTAAKGMLVDFPLALTEGLKSTPKLFGTKVRDHGPVTDAKSGAAVAGKTFAFGFADGLTDLVMEPIRGGRDDGAVGAVKGVGKGVVSLAVKSGAGMFGLFAYPSAGIAKSLRTAVHGGTRKMLAKAKHVEGQWLLARDMPPGSTGDDWGNRFRELRKGKGKDK